MRNIRRAIVITSLMFFGMVCGAHAGATIHVSPDGDDNAAGKGSAPFRTIVRAQREVHERFRAGFENDVTVLIGGGTYYLDEPLVFGPQDGGTDEHAVVYAAAADEQPVISGGRPIRGFRRSGPNEWVVQLDDVKAGAWWFRQLFVDGQRQPRARFPNPPEVLRITSTSEDVTRISFDQPIIGGSLAGQDAELVVLQNWSITRAAVASSQDATVTTTTPVGWIGHGAQHNITPTTASPGKPSYLEHAPAFMDQPGEWHLDREAGRLTFRTTADFEPGDHTFIAPHLDKLVIVRGERDRPVRNLHFRGLTFAYTGWDLPPFGYAGIQAGHHGTSIRERIHVLPAAVEFAHARACGLDRCRILHTGASGIGIGPGCRRNVIDRCEVRDIAGSGIMVGLRTDEVFTANNAAWGLISEWTDPQDVPHGNEVTNCRVLDCGAVYSGCVGIYDAYCENTRIAHNLVADLPYTGISVGYKWNSEPSSQRGCRVEYNHVRNVMTLLADGGAIYTLGYQPGTILRGNLLHDVHRSRYAHGGAPNNGVFFDQGSKGYLVEGNIIYHTSGEPIRFNQCRREDHTWKDNHFGVAPGDPNFPQKIAAHAGPEVKRR